LKASEGLKDTPDPGKYEYPPLDDEVMFWDPPRLESSKAATPSWMIHLDDQAPSINHVGFDHNDAQDSFREVESREASEEAEQMENSKYFPQRCRNTVPYNRYPTGATKNIKGGDNKITESPLPIR
jgi:hypothetical protein